MSLSLRRSTRTTTAPLSFAMAARRPSARSVSPSARNTLLMVRPLRSASVTALSALIISFKAAIPAPPVGFLWLFGIFFHGCLCFPAHDTPFAISLPWEALNQSSAADAGAFSSIHRYEKLEILRSRWRLCRLTDAACPLPVSSTNILAFSISSPCQNTSRHPLLLIESELPYIIAKNRAGDNTENRRTGAKRAEIRTKIQIHRKFTAHFAMRIAESTKIWYDAGEAKGGRFHGESKPAKQTKRK